MVENTVFGCLWLQEMVGEFKADFYYVNNLILESRKRWFFTILNVKNIRKFLVCSLENIVLPT